MKRILYVFSILSILLSLCACKQKPETDKTELTGASGSDTSYSLEADTSSAQNSAETDTQQDISSDEQVEGKDYVLVYSASAEFSAEELADKSDLIVICRYDGITSQITPDQNAAGYTNNVYTQQTAKLINTIKGNAPSDINIRRIGGTDSSGNVVRSNDPELTAGKQYMLYLSKLPPATSTDNSESYSIIDCFEIDESGNLDISGKTEEDADEINTLYKEYTE